MQRMTMKSDVREQEPRAELIRRASAAANNLLAKSERVLVVYGKGEASIYYDAPARQTRTVA